MGGKFTASSGSVPMMEPHNKTGFDMTLSSTTQFPLTSPSRESGINLWANGLLMGTTTLFVGSHFIPVDLLPGGNWMLGALKAASEAAMVGGLADWFAVTALFRRPFGLPIPHTALIPRKKDQIGEALGTFVQDRFLDPEPLRAWIRRENRAVQIATWLSKPATGESLADGVVDVLSVLLRHVGDSDLRVFLQEIARDRLHRSDATPLTDALLKAILDDDRHLKILDTVLELVRPRLRQNRDEIVRIVGARLGAFVPTFIDCYVADQLIGGIENFLDLLATPGTIERTGVDTFLRSKIHEFRNSPDYPRKVAEVKRHVTESAALRSLLDRTLDEFKRDLLSDLGSPSPRIGRAAADLVRTIGAALARNEHMLEYLNQVIEAIVIDVLVPFRSEIGTYIAKVVQGWDGKKVAETIEAQVGGDLQYVRINGTLLGALIGFVLFAASSLLGGH
jgi:uncharacterized membrane-anchored protein YjiN (DUF445 family)